MPAKSPRRNTALAAPLLGVPAPVPMPEFIDVQLCADKPPDRETGEWIEEVKWDGWRIELRVLVGRAALRSRENITWTDLFQAVAKAGSALPDCMLDGELVAFNEQGRPSRGLLQSMTKRRMRPPPTAYYAFDALIIEGRDLRQCPLVVRKEALRRFLERHPSDVIRFVESFPADAGLFEASCEQRLEGVVRKRVDAVYQSGRSKTWVKKKCRKP